MNQFAMQSWNEHAYHEGTGGQKLARASVVNRFEGMVEGEGTLEYLLHYREDGSVYFTGLERVTGRLDGREGSFVLQHNGTLSVDGGLQATWSVLPGSGTGELRGLSGEGGFAAVLHEKVVPYTLAYRLG